MGRMQVRPGSDDASVVLRTERLLLRRLSMDDLEALAAIYVDPEVRRFFPEGTLTREETREEIAWTGSGARTSAVGISLPSPSRSVTIGQSVPASGTWKPVSSPPRKMTPCASR